jgi:hypothetical protein
MYSSSIRVPDTSIPPLEVNLDSDELINQFLQSLSRVTLVNISFVSSWWEEAFTLVAAAAARRCLMSPCIWLQHHSMQV